MVTVPDENTFIEYSVVASSTGPFTFDYPYFQKADLEVRVDGVALATSAFTDTPGSGSATAGYDGGSITLVTAIANATLTIARNMTAERTSNLSAGNVTGDNINAAVNKLTMHAQERRRDTERAIKVPVEDTGGDTTLPDETDRASKALAFDSSGNIELIARTDLTALGARTAEIDALAARTTEIDAIYADISGSDTIGDAAALLAITAPGIVCKNTSGSPVSRTLTGGTGISIADGDGGAGDPTISLDAELVDIAGITPNDGIFIVGDGNDFVGESGDTALISLGGTAIGISTFKATDGTAGQFLKTDGAGGASFATPAGGGDTLAAANETVTGDWDFTGTPTLNSSPLVSKAYSDNQRTASYTTLKALAAGLYSSVVVEDADRGGVFVWRSGDQSANITADAGEGVWVPPSSDVTGASGAWERQYGGPVLAQWFGFPTADDTSTDYQSIFQNAVDFAQSVNQRLKLPANVSFRTDSPVVFKHGVDGGSRFNVDIDGNGCTWFPQTNQNCLVVNPLGTAADAVAGNGDTIGGVAIKNINFNGFNLPASSTSCAAITLGSDGYAVDCFERGRIENVLMEGFDTPPLVVRQARHIDFVRVVSRDTTSGGLDIAQESSGFCGDISFVDCEFTGSEAARPLAMSATSASGTAELRGVRFVNTVFYGAGAQISAGNNGKVGDVWFTSCAWDGPVGGVSPGSGEKPLDVVGSGTGQLFKIFFDSPYIVGYTGPVNVTTNSTSTIKDIQFNGGGISGISPAGGNSVLQAFGVENLLIQGVGFNANTAPAEVRVFASQYTDVSNISSLDSTLSTAVVSVEDASDDVIIGQITTDQAAKVSNTATGSPTNIYNIEALSFSINGTSVLDSNRAASLTFAAVDNIQIDGNTVSSTTGNLLLSSAGGVVETGFSNFLMSGGGRLFGLNLHYAGGWKFSENNSNASWALTESSGELVFKSAPANSSGPDAAATVTDRLGLDAAGNLDLKTGALEAAGTQVVGARGAAVGKVSTTYTTGTPPTPDGSLTVADAAAPTNAELLEFCIELESKLETLIDRVGATSGHGLTAD